MNGYLIYIAIILTVLAVVCLSNWLEIGKLRKRVHRNDSDVSAAMMGVYMLVKKSGDKDLEKSLDADIRKRLKALEQSPYAHFRRADEEENGGS